MIAERGAVFEKAVTKVRYFPADEQTRCQIESYEKARRDELMRINDAYEDGEAKGEARAQERIAINMLEKGMSHGDVIELSGLSEARVAELDKARRSGL